MFKIKCPEYNAKEVFNECVSKKRDPDLKARLKSSKQDIVSAEEAYIDKALKGNLHQVQTALTVGQVTSQEMENLYTSTFARQSSSLRTKYYDVLKLAPLHDICPMCGQRNIDTLCTGQAISDTSHL